MITKEEKAKKIAMLERNLQDLERDFKAGLVKKASYQVRKADVKNALRVYKKGVHKKSFII